MARILIGVIIFGLFMIYVILASEYDIRLERTEPKIGDKETLIDFDEFKSIRIKKTHYLNGSWTHYVDLDETYLVSGSMEYSSRGDGNFIKHRYQVPKIGACEYFNTTYKKYTMPAYRGHSNFPIIPPEGLCPIPKGKYYVKNIEYNDDMLPLNLQNGIWKLNEFYYNKDNETIGGISIYLRILNKSS